MKLGPLEAYNPDNPEHRDATKYIIEYESTGRRPESVKFDVSLKQDLSRRDLTVNSMAIDVDGNIIDYFDGRGDIKNKVLKTVGNPHDRFKEDFLRTLRTARFSAKLGFTIDPDTKNAAKELAHNITKLSPERIKDELFKAAAQPGEKFAKYILELDEMGILDIILPEITKLKEMVHSTVWHPEGAIAVSVATGHEEPYDPNNPEHVDPSKYTLQPGNVWDHIIAALKTNKLINPLVNISILLHDTGKGMPKDYKDGVPLYYDHAEVGVGLVNTIASRLKLSSAERETLLFTTLNHMKFHKILEMKPSKILKLVRDRNWDVLKAVGQADEHARGETFKYSGEFEKIVDRAIEIKDKYGMVSLERTLKLVDGNNVMRLTGLKPGKKVGDIIKQTTEWIVDSNTNPDDTEAIEAYIRGLT